MRRPIKRLLIANRGEIAVRVIRTAKALGIETVALYSDADAHAAHVQMADTACHIGPATASESYLRADKVIAVARTVGADAVHPGYGFLSENADFREACDAAGLMFLGPSAAAMRAMGLKGEAKALMQEAGVPVVPGYHGADQSLERMTAEALRIGFPLLIKAVAGGGGKGMRRVDRAEDLEAALESARREGQNSFNNPELLIEKYIEKPRHIEMQVFADSHGNTVHLWERDCSLQRRHQKVVEEAPAPGMTEELRASMGAAAIKAAKAVGYEGAGTVEFIVDVAAGIAGAPFYFMEMNTRLQVEHPVTEAITGFDLVEWQIRIAEGAALPAGQQDIDARTTGHAVEVRLYAEDPKRDFAPQVGTISLFSDRSNDMPAHPSNSYAAQTQTQTQAQAQAQAAPNLPPLLAGQRIDAGVRAGDAVSVYYDPMIAKLIAHAPTRLEAIQSLQQLISSTPIAGLRTNRDFLYTLIGQAAFKAGDIDTGFIADHSDTLFAQSTETEASYAEAALTLLALRRQSAKRTNLNAGVWGALDNFRLNLPHEEMVYFRAPDRAAAHSAHIAPNAKSVANSEATSGTNTDLSALVAVRCLLNGQDWLVSSALISADMSEGVKPVTPEDYGFDADFGGETFSGRADTIGTSAASTGAETSGFHITLDGVRRTAHALLGDDTLTLISGPYSHHFSLFTPSQAASSGADGLSTLTAPMPGKILEVRVSEGQKVEKDTPLIVMEAMKMEQTLLASRSGIIANLNLQAGQLVSDGQILLTIDDA